MNNLPKFSTRYGATLTYLRYAISKFEDSYRIGVVCTPITYPDVAAAVLRCPCNIFLVDIEEDSELPSATQVANILEDANIDNLIVVISQVANQYLSKGLRDLSDNLSFLYVSNDLYHDSYGISVLNPVLPSAAIFHGSSEEEAAMNSNSRHVLGEYTNLTITQQDAFSVEKVEAARDEIKERMLYAASLGLKPLTVYSSSITVECKDAVVKSSTLRAAGFQAGSPVLPLHKMLSINPEEEYTNSDKFISTHISVPIMLDNYKEALEMLK